MNIIEQLKSMSEVDVKRQGKVFEWEFSKMTMDKNGIWTLVMDITDPMHVYYERYSLSLVLNPINYNRNLNGNISKYENPQKEIFNNDEEFLNNSRKIISDYEKESELYGIYDFESSLIKLARKPKCTQVTFFITADVAEYFRANFYNLHQSAIVIERKS